MWLASGGAKGVFVPIVFAILQRELTYNLKIRPPEKSIKFHGRSTLKTNY